MIAILILISICGIAAGIFLLVNNAAAKQKNKPPIKGAKPLIITSLIVLLISSTIVKIGAQEVGVVVTPSGVKDAELQSGTWNFVWWWNNVYRMDKTVWVYTCAKVAKEGQKVSDDAIWTPTKDGIKMGFDVSSSWRIDPAEAAWIYQNVSENDGGSSGRYLWLEENVIRTKLKSAMAVVISEYTPLEAYSTKRDEIQQKVKMRMTKDVAMYHILIDNIDLREVYYNDKYETAINNIQLAEKETKRLEEVTRQQGEKLTQAKINKDIAIEQAKGESEALRIKGLSISSNPAIIQLEWIEAWKSGGAKVPTYITSGSSGNMFMLNPAN